MDGGAHGNSPRILNQISKISQWTSSGGGYDLKNQRSSLLWVASLHPAVTVVPGHEFGISRNIHDGNIYNHHGCCGNIPKSGDEEPNAFTDPPLLVDRDEKQKKRWWWNPQLTRGGREENVSWDKSEWSWQSERSPLSKQSLLRSYLFSAYPHPSHNPFINTEKELLISRGSVDWVTQQLPWLDEISKLWELPKLFKIHIFSFLGTMLAIFLVYISLSPLPKVVLVLTGSQCPLSSPSVTQKLAAAIFPTLHCHCQQDANFSEMLTRLFLCHKGKTKLSTSEINNEAEKEYHTKNVSDLFRLYAIHIRLLCQSSVVINFEDKCWYKLWTNE